MITDNQFEHLKQSGVKITAPRKQILKTLSFSPPLSAQDVSLILKQKGFKIDLVTIYRTLELFANLKLVRKTQFEDKITRYELRLGKSHHHHLVCLECGIIQDVEINEVKIINEVEKQTNFKLERHALEFFGFCKKCQKR